MREIPSEDLLERQQDGVQEVSMLVPGIHHMLSVLKDVLLEQTESVTTSLSDYFM